MFYNMAYNIKKKNVSVVNDDPCEGKVFDFPQCINCVHNIDGFCEVFNMERLRLMASKKTDIYNCKEFESKY